MNTQTTANPMGWSEVLAMSACFVMVAALAAIAVFPSDVAMFLIGLVP